MVKKPLALDHYTYLNELLSLKDDQRLEPKKDIANKEELIKKTIEQQKAFEAIIAGELAAEAQENALKIQRALEILQDDKKREQYDAALTSTPNVSLKHSDKKGKEFIALVPIENIINEFNDFKKQMLELKNEKGESLYSDKNFKYEKIAGPPTVHIFTFPDEESANKFMDRLLSKNMAMYPNGSQSNEVKPAQTVKSYKEGLGALKPEVAEEQPEISPTPFTRAK